MVCNCIVPGPALGGILASFAVCWTSLFCVIKNQSLPFYSIIIIIIIIFRKVRKLHCSHVIANMSNIWSLRTLRKMFPSGPYRAVPWMLVKYEVMLSKCQCSARFLTACSRKWGCTEMY